jgi:hypothetical protein
MRARISRVFACRVSAALTIALAGAQADGVAQLAPKVSTSPDPDRGAVAITVNPAKTHAISPYIYGLNFATKVDDAPAGVEFDRTGGNRWTAYNWETNTSNAGRDYQYQNDRYLGNNVTPGGIVADLIDTDRRRGMASLITVQMQGYVSADDRGPVKMSNPPDVARFRKVVHEKATVSREPFTLTPSVSDDAVYTDEFLWAMDRKFAGQNIFGATPTTKPVFISLDNEPELWNQTHLEVQGAKNVSADDFIARTRSIATAIKKQFPNAVIFGPAHFGFMGMYNWLNEMKATPNGSDWFTDRYLKAMKSASTAAGRRLVDVYDFHWYSEATDSAGTRVVSLTGPKLTDSQVQAVVQSPRSLYDRTFRENSWISKAVLGGPIALLDRLQSRIDASNPGMKLALTEYHNGGALHIAGTIAQADNLGIFGARGLFAAAQWQMSPREPYILAAFRAYRDFDGTGHNYGDTSVEATSGDPSRVVVYVSTDSEHAGRVVMVAINRSTTEQSAIISGQPLRGTARRFQITAASARQQSQIRPVPAGTQPVSGRSLTLKLPPLSVTTVDISL